VAPGGITPTTVVMMLSMLIRRPITFGSPPNRCCQNECAITATGAAPAR
jgi:hypothetical protein